MNKVTINGRKIIQTSEFIEVDGIRTDIPTHVKSASNNCSIINSDIFINGYKFNPISRTFTKLNFIQRFLNWLFS